MGEQNWVQGEVLHHLAAVLRWTDITHSQGGSRGS